MIKVTTIKISKQTAERLSRLKVHPRQPYEEVILHLILKPAKAEPARKPGIFGSREKKKEITTIKLSKQTAERLSRLKVHPRQPYEEVILKALGNEKTKKRE